MSKIEVNAIEPQSGTTLTLGASGDTVTLAAGASQSGFGRSGSVNWDTTPKTTTVTAVSGNGYFINTTSGGVTVNLPVGTAGAIVALSDYAATWNTNAVTVNANGTEKIGGVASAPAILNTRGQAVTFVYVDSTRGWTNVGDATYVAGSAFVSATGGTITTCGDYKIHAFTASGCFVVSSSGAPTGSNSVDYLVVAGGGASSIGGGGGAGGGYRFGAVASCAGLPVSVATYPITIGAGGAGSVVSPPAARQGSDGSPSIFSTITSAGGGAGGRESFAGISGGSGGGAGGGEPALGAGSGNTPPVSPPQGNPGGGSPSPSRAGSGGGGAGAAGTTGNGPITSGGGGAGGAGSNAHVPTFGAAPKPFYQPDAANTGATSTGYMAGGGGGGGWYNAGPSCAPGGIGGGGRGMGNPYTAGTTTGGRVNSGGGGGGEVSGIGSPGACTASTHQGGSGIVLIRYKYQ